MELPRLVLVFAATSLVPLTPTVCDNVDAIELNHVYDGRGRLMLRQLIFWDWDERSARRHVIAWRLWKPGQPTPLRNAADVGYTLVFRDGKVLRRVRARVYRETWTQFDPEIDDRRRLSEDRRRGLIRLEPPASIAQRLRRVR